MRGMSEFDPSVRTTKYGNMDRPDYAAEEYYSDENHFRDFINIDNAKNCWVRNATALHFVNTMVGTQRGIQVDHRAGLRVARTGVGARAAGAASSSRCAGSWRWCSAATPTRAATRSWRASPRPAATCTSTAAPPARIHRASRMSNGPPARSYDNVHAPLTARYWKNFTIGWAGANTVFWNCEGDFLVQKPPTAQNFSFGHMGVNAVIFNTEYQDLKKENGHIESIDRHVTPRSLYLAQLRDRLGDAAVRRVATADQLA